jgi:serine/threonine protein phosphatase 1
MPPWNGRLKAWWSELFGRPSPCLPEGVRVYAVGDIHGRSDLLERILSGIVIDDREQPPALTKVIFVGDYCDRGSGSREVVDLLLDFRHRSGFEVRFLKGNHDLLFHEVIQTGRSLWPWLELGGLSTLRSYGITPPAEAFDPAAPTQVREALLEAMPLEHWTFYEELELFIVIGDYQFVHAGVRNGIPLDAQKEEDLLWIRDAFLLSHSRLDRVIVHGHTPQYAATFDGRRIGLDTGAYSSGLLSGVRLQGHDQALFSVRLEPPLPSKGQGRKDP